jgi:hypothetical protein
MTDLDTPAIGHKIARLMHDNRPALVKLLSGTDRDLWPQLARAYLLAIGATDFDQTIPAVLYVWGQLTKETD